MSVDAERVRGPKAMVLERTKQMADEAGTEAYDAVKTLFSRYPGRVSDDVAEGLAGEERTRAFEGVQMNRRTGHLNDLQSTSTGITVYLTPDSLTAWQRRLTESGATYDVSEIEGEDGTDGCLELWLQDGAYQMGTQYGNLYAQAVIDEGIIIRTAHPMGIEPRYIKAIVGDDGDLWVNPDYAYHREVEAIFEVDDSPSTE